MSINTLFHQADKLAWEYFHHTQFARHPIAVVAALLDLGFYDIEFTGDTFQATYLGVTYNLTGETYAQHRI